MSCVDDSLSDQNADEESRRDGEIDLAAACGGDARPGEIELQHAGDDGGDEHGQQSLANLRGREIEPERFSQG